MGYQDHPLIQKDVPLFDLDQLTGTDVDIGREPLDAEPYLGIDLVGDTFDLVQYLPLGLLVDQLPKPQFKPHLGELGYVLDFDEPAFSEPVPKTIEGRLDVVPRLGAQILGQQEVLDVPVLDVLDDPAPQAVFALPR